MKSNENFEKQNLRFSLSRNKVENFEYVHGMDSLIYWTFPPLLLSLSLFLTLFIRLVIRQKVDLLSMFLIS